MWYNDLFMIQIHICGADSRFVPSQWETSLQSNAISLARRKPRISSVSVNIHLTQWRCCRCTVNLVYCKSTISLSKVVTAIFHVGAINSSLAPLFYCICVSHTTTWYTHWGREKMAVIFQTTFSNAFSSMKIFEFRLKLHWSLFLRVRLTVFHHWFR